MDESTSSSSGERDPAAQPKDPRTIARKYQLDLCKRAVEENIIVFLGTGCGKTHIAVLLMYELGHLIRKPSREVCIFLAPTIPLVRQQAMVIENSTDFKVRCYYGNGKNSKDHHEWEKEIEQSEVLVMTPQILLHNLRHCFIKMDLIALLIFDECHHAQAQTRHPYAQIMKEFYRIDGLKCPRVFGMTASPIIGKGGSDQQNYTKCINSLEHLLDAKVCSVDNVELDSVVASPDVDVYLYGPVNFCASSLTVTYNKKLDELKLQCESMLRQNLCDVKDSRKKLKYLWKLHDNLIFCLHNLGLCGAQQAARTLLSSDGDDLVEREAGTASTDICFANQYLSKALSILSANLLDDELGADSFTLETLEEPFFSKKLSVLIEVLSSYRLQENMKCIVFVKRIIVAGTLAFILRNLKCLDFWQCEFLVGCHSGLRNMSRKKMNAIVEKFSSGEVNLLVATSVAEEGLDIQTCCLVVRFDLPETVASFIQSRGRARMAKSKYVFLLERGNQCEKKLLNDFGAVEGVMNKEIETRSSNDVFNCLEETIYRVNGTGASISTACSVSLLHHYCGNLPRDKFFTPSPKFFYIDDNGGIICRIILPPNAAFRQVDGLPCPSKDEAKRNACLKACRELHELGALSDYLLPGPAARNMKVSTTNSVSNTSEDESREELHQMLIPGVLKPSGCNLDSALNLHFYYVSFIPIPTDRCYRMFGLFVINPLPKEAEDSEVDLHLAHGRIVKAGIKHSGTMTFDRDEIMLAQNFQEMFLKILLDRSEFSSSHILLGKNDALDCNSTFYLLLPIKQKIYGDKFMIDWTTVRCCLSSPVFQHPSHLHVKGSNSANESLNLFDGIVSKDDVVGSLVYTPHNNLFFFIDGILHEVKATTKYKNTSYAEHYKERFGIQLSHPEQPLLKAKQLFCLHNLLHNRLQKSTGGRELPEHFVEIPPELCSLKIIGFSKDIGSSLSLLPSLMHRLENLLVAIELKDVMLSSFSEASGVRASCILEALTTERCLERFSLERFEVLGDAFLKYAVGRHSFVSYEGLDEGQLTRRRSAIVNNSNLYELAISRNLQAYIRDQQFEPAQFFAPGRPCKIVCNLDNEATIHQKKIDSASDRRESCNLRCNKSHHWLHRKTIADVVEALLGAFLVESGFKAAFAFLRWVGMEVQFEVSSVYKVFESSYNNLSLADNMNVAELEELLGYKFKYKGLILQALIHPSYNKHSGGCYQKLEFLGDAVLEYLITSYLYSAYPDLKPGQITDLRSIAVNNNSFAHIAVWRSIHKYLIKESNHLTTAINKFENFVRLPDPEKDLLEEPACPKVLGDIVESCVGAVLLDTGFDLNHVWRLMLTLLEPVLSFSSMHINPVRELRELCQSQSYGFELGLPKPMKINGDYFVKVEVDMKGNMLTCSATNRNSKAARKVAAQEALSKLKDYGYKHKNKSLEDILHATRKNEAELIGFDEEPLKVEFDMFIQMENLQISKQGESNLPSQNREVAFPFSFKTSTQRTEDMSKVDSSDYCDGGGMINKTARSSLFEICAANYWNPPVFECCKEEGPSHLRKFTYKAVVQIRGIASTILECYSDAMLQKKAAQEHAAEGVLWYLKQLGYLPKD